MPGKKEPILLINTDTIMAQKPRDDEVSRRVLSREPNSRGAILNTQ